MAKKPILALDVGSHTLKLAEFVDVRGGLEMTRYAVSDLGLDPQADTERSQYIITTIHDLIRESGCKPGPVLLSISGHSVFSRFVKLPPVEPEKVYQIIQYEAQQNVPFPMNEVVWDYQLISGATGDVDVMLAAIKSDHITEISDCVRFAGLVPELVDVAPMALYNAVRYNYDALPPCTLVVDIGARSTDLIFLEAGRVFSRSVPVAGNHITQLIMNEFAISFDDAEAMKKAHAYVAFGGAYEGPQSETVDKVSKSVRSMMARLHQELNRSINFYRSQQGGQQPSLLLLTGGSSVIPYTDTFLKEKLRVETDYFNPFNNVAVAEQIPAEQVGAHACEMGQLVGLALRQLHTCPIEVNLLPPKAVEEKKFKRKQPVFALAAAVALLTLIVWISFYHRLSATMGGIRTRLDGRVQELSSVERRLVQAETKVAGVENQIGKLTALEANRGVWRSLLGEISGALVEGMWLTRVAPVETLPGEAAPAAAPDDRRPGRGNPAASAPVPTDVIAGLEIEGMGYLDKIKSDQITEFRNKLRESELFSDQTEIVWQPPARPDAATLEFKILAVLEAPKEL
ncbi:MAG TPA: type IV pilus assembly protein PilM [Kiritimatiellia bacterium]|nr:type IV pilus assembly protein PilM [Kiritimatiellia bacterium]HRX05767.1 type IV pilus assembly protein PilM [Kiritimatiellia bacterium]